MGHIACEDYPGPEVHHNHQLDEVDEHQARREEYAHPHLSLVINQRQNVLGYLKVAVLPHDNASGAPQMQGQKQSVPLVTVESSVELELC